MKFKRILNLILILIFIIIFSICVYTLLKDLYASNENNRNNENLIEKTIRIDEETQERKINWNYLKSVNEDIIAWIEIENTNIDYPILKDNNLYYLKHTFDGKYNSNGSIFTTNENPFTDKETVIYGHNMKNGTMFSNLEKYLDLDFIYSNLKFKIYTPNINYEANIIGVYSIGFEIENNNIKQLEFDEKIEYYKKTSKYKIQSNDNINKIVKLITCSYINANTNPTDQRYYIIANIVEI